MEKLLEGIKENEVLKAICTKKCTLKSNPYNVNGMEKYVWRMIRFHTGIDNTMPILCFFDLQNWIESKGYNMDDINVCGIINPKGKILLDYLDKMVDSLSIKLGLNPFNASIKWKNAGLF